MDELRQNKIEDWPGYSTAMTIKWRKVMQLYELITKIRLRLRWLCLIATTDKGADKLRIRSSGISSFGCLFQVGLLLGLLFEFWRWRRHVPSELRLTFSRLHGVISQKIELFIITTVTTSDPTKFIIIVKWNNRKKNGTISNFSIALFFIVDMLRNRRLYCPGISFKRQFNVDFTLAYESA
jgi:hypothetical protein